MRQIFPVNNTGIIDPAGDNFITKDELARLVVKFEDLKTAFDILSKSLEDYKQQNQAKIITENLSAVDAILDNIDALTILVEAIDVSKTLKADQINAITGILTDKLRAVEASINTLKADTAELTGDISAINASFDTVKARVAEIEEWTVDVLQANEVNASRINSDVSAMDYISSNNTVVKDLESVRTKASESIESPLIASNLMDAFEITTSNLHWKEYQTFTDFDTFDLAFPHFENGSYLIRITSENGRPLLAFENYNSMDNYRCYWSQYELGFLETISISKDELKVVLHINNSQFRFPLRIWFANISAESEEAPKTYEVFPDEIQSVYEVRYKDGGKFWKPVDMWDTGSKLAYLETSTTSKFEETVDRIIYDPSGEDKQYIIYKPDQEVNSDSSVRFQEVKAPFLEVEELEVFRKVKLPNLYNGEPVEPDTLPNDSIYIPASDEENGNQALVVYEGEKYSSLDNALKGFTAEDEWVSRTFDTADTTQITYRGEDKFYIIDNRYAAVFIDELLYMLDFYSAGDILYSDAVIDGQPVYDDQGVRQEELTDEFYVDSVKHEITGRDIEFYKETARWHTGAVGGIIYRKSANGVDEIIPIDEEARKDIEPTNPITYDADKRAFVASDDIDIKNNLTVGGDITFEGDLEVGGNIDAAGDITADGDLTIAGDAVVSGKSTFADDVEIKGKLSVDKDLSALSDLHVSGDLYVEGTQHITKTEDLDTEADIITLRTNNPSGLGDNQVSGILINKYDGEQDLALVTGNKGVLRVGTAKGEDTEYTNIAYDPSTKKWYEWDDGELGDEVELDNASITSWTNKRTEGSYTVYDSITLTAIDKTSLVPLLGRSEEEDLDDNSLLKWDAEKQIAVKVGLPDSSNQVLESKVEDGKVSYNWVDASSFVFIGTREEYDERKQIPKGEPGFISDSSLVIITDEPTYLKGVHK